MPLGNVGEFYAWIERETPSVAAQEIARTFILELGERPWAAPSTPNRDVSNQPEFEVRTAALDVPGEPHISLWWEHVYATGVVDLLAVTNR